MSLRALSDEKDVHKYCFSGINTNSSTHEVKMLGGVTLKKETHTQAAALDFAG